MDNVMGPAEKRNVVLVRDSTRSPTMSGSVNPDEAGAFGTAPFDHLNF